MKSKGRTNRSARFKNIIHNNKRLLIYIAVVLVIFIYFIIKMLPEPSVFIQSDITSFSVPAKVYAFKDEEYVIINSTEKIHFLCTEGDKVSASTLLSDNYSLSTNVYINKKLDVLNFVLQNTSITTKEQIYVMISDVNKQLLELDSLLNEANAANDADKAKQLATQREALQQQLYVLKRAMQYVYNTYSDNAQIKDNFAGMLGRSDIPLTLENLDFSVFGNIYYSIDGFESSMNFDSLDSIDIASLNNLDSMSPVKTNSDGKYYIKSSAGDKMVLLLRIDKDSYVADEEAVNSYYSKLCDKYNMDQEGGYINFIFRRVDVLNNFPDFYIKTEDGIEYKGNIVQVISEENEDKIIVLAIRNDVVSFANRRIFTAKANTETFRCFAIPTSCIYNYNGATYVNILKDATIKTPTQVTVYKTEGSTSYLKTSENSALKDGDEIILKGRQQ